MKDRLKNIRLSLGFKSQNKFAIALDIDASYINRMENGKQCISIDFVDKVVARFPSVSREYFETGVGEPLKPESPASEPVDGLESAKAFLLDLFRSLPPDKQSTLAELAKAIVEERPAPSPGEKKA